MDRAHAVDPLLQSSWFWMGETLQAILASSAVVGNAGLLFSFTTSKSVIDVLPRDLRYLNCSKTVSALMISSCVLIKSLLTFVGASTVAHPYYARTIGGNQRRVHYFDLCNYQIGLATAASVSMITAIVGASLQRLLASFASIPMRNSQNKKQYLSAPCYLSIAWLVSFSMALFIAMIMPPRTNYWHECSPVYLLPRTIIIGVVISVPIITLLSVLMEVAAWLSTKRDVTEEQQRRRTRMEEIVPVRDSNDNSIQTRRHTISNEASLTEMNLPSVLLFASCWSMITLFLAYERLIPSFNPDSYLFNVYEKSPYYDADGGYIDNSKPPVKTFILSQFFIYIPLLIEITLDPLFTYWKKPTRHALTAEMELDTDNRNGESDRLLETAKEKAKEESKSEGKTIFEEEKTISELHHVQLTSDEDEDLEH